MLAQLVRKLDSERVGGIESEDRRERIRGFLHGIPLEGASRARDGIIDPLERRAGLALHPERVGLPRVGLQELFRLGERGTIVLLGEASLHELDLAREKRLAQLLRRVHPIRCRGS